MRKLAFNPDRLALWYFFSALLLGLVALTFMLLILPALD